MHARMNCILRGLPLVIAIAMLLPATESYGQATDNAADLYRESFEHYERYEWEDFVPLQQFLDNPTVAPSHDARAFLNRYKQSLDLFQRASTRRDANFGVNYDDGMMLLMPQLAQMRQVAKMAKADFHVKLFDGDTAGAARRLASIYGSSRHITQDGTVIGTLVGIAITALAEGTAEPAFKRAAFSIGDAQRLHRMIDRFDEIDPFNVAGAYRGEHEITRSELKDLADLDDFGRMRKLKTMESIQFDGGEFDGERIISMTADEIDDAIALHGAMTSEAIEIVRMTDDEEASKAMTDLAARVEKGEFGVFAPHSITGFQKTLQQHHRGRKMVNDRRAMLEELIKTGSAEAAAGAAYFYIRAIAKLDETITPEDLEALRTAAENRVAPEADIADLMQRLQPVHELVQQGAARSECDFSPYRPRGRAMLAPPYAAGLYELADAMHLHATVRRRTEPHDDAVNNLLITIRFAAHLGTDTQPMTSAIAHDMFVRALPTLESTFTDSSTTPEQRADLREAVARISRTDPFGYGAYDTNSPIRWVTRHGLPQEVYQRYVVVKDNWTADLWYFLAAVLEHAYAYDLLPRHHNQNDVYMDEYRYATDPDDLAILARLYNEQALERARDLTPQVIAMFREGQFDSVDQLEVPLILDIAGRMNKARRDLARALRLTGSTDDG